MRSGVEVCLYLSIAGPAFPCRAPREKIEGDDGTGRGGSPTLRCYQEQEGEEQEEDQEEEEEEEEELEEKEEEEEEEMEYEKEEKELEEKEEE